MYEVKTAIFEDSPEVPVWQHFVRWINKQSDEGWTFEDLLDKTFTWAKQGDRRIRRLYVSVLFSQFHD